jgi:hypothetical protein
MKTATNRYHWAVVDRMTGEIRSRHIYHATAESHAKGLRYQAIPINIDIDEPYAYRYPKHSFGGRFGGIQG